MAIEDADIFRESGPQQVTATLETKETDCVPLENLYILIHPLGMTQGALGKRKQMVENIKEKLEPGKKDLVWFMPMQIKEEIGETKRLLRRAEKDSTPGGEDLNWPSLYKTLRGDMGREKIMLVPEIVFNRIDGEKDLIEDYVSGMMQKARERGFKVNGQTRVTLGGEAIDACLKKGAIKFLQHLPVNQVEIDLSLSAPSASRSTQDAIQDVVVPVNRGVWGTNLHAQYTPGTDRIIITKE